jgi:hypothetical protein
MSWLTVLSSRAIEARADTVPVRTGQEGVRHPPDERESKPEIQHVWFTTRRPRNEHDLGEVEGCYYSIADGVVTLCDEDGKPIGEPYQLRPDEDPKNVAARLGAEAWRKARGDGPGKQPLSYPPLGIV